MSEEKAKSHNRTAEIKPGVFLTTSGYDPENPQASLGAEPQEEPPTSAEKVLEPLMGRLIHAERKKARTVKCGVETCSEIAVFNAQGRPSNPHWGHNPVLGWICDGHKPDDEYPTYDCLEGRCGHVRCVRCNQGPVLCFERDLDAGIALGIELAQLRRAKEASLDAARQFRAHFADIAEALSQVQDFAGLDRVRAIAAEGQTQASELVAILEDGGAQ